LGADDAKRLRGFQFLSAKPLLIVLNLDEADLPQADDAVRMAGLESFLAGAATRAVPICARIELEIAQLDAADASAFMADLGLRESGLDRVIRASYDLLGYISFFTVGEDECRAWSIPRNTPASLPRGDSQRHLPRVHSRRGRGTNTPCPSHDCRMP
jgi:ribosome-binding ATPase YchF (GTP1/OBG family)